MVTAIPIYLGRYIQVYIITANANLLQTWLYLYMHAVSLLSTEGRLFRGVLLQGRTVADGSPAGTFEASDPLLRLSDCNTPQVSLVKRVDWNGALGAGGPL